MQINPKQVVERKIISNFTNLDEQLQQNGIDLTLKEDLVLENMSHKNIELTESFDMQDTFGVMHVRSSLSRKGIFMSFGLFDSGFCGNGGVSIYNMSGSKLELPKGFRVCQMVIYKGDPAKMYSGHYNQTTSVESKLK